MQRLAIIGGGPSSLFIFKRLLESGRQDIGIDIFEKSGGLGCGMPYSHEGSADEHVTNVSGNEIPDMITSLAAWIKTVSKDTLDKYHIDPNRFNDYKVLPRLLFGDYLCDQYKLLLKKARAQGLTIQVRFHTEVTDITDDGREITVITHDNEYHYDRVVLCTGHYWPKKHEGQIPGWFDSPYPPEKISLKANHAVAIRGASLTAIDAIRTLARHNGRFEKDDQDKLHFYAGPESPDFRLVLHTRNGLLPAVRFHLEDSHLGKGSVLSGEKIAANRAANEGFLSLDYVFDKNFKKIIREHDPACYEEIMHMNMEKFVEHMMAQREHHDPFELLKAEYATAARSIKNQRSIYWQEQLAILSFAMNYPAKHFSAEDMLRLQNTLMPLISVIIAFMPQSSAETLMALHDAGRLSMVKVGNDIEPLPAAQGADYGGKHYDLFIDCAGQPHLSFEEIPFEGIKNAGSPASLRFRDQVAGRQLAESGDKRVGTGTDGTYELTVPGLAINDHFQLLDRYGALNERIYMMAVPFIGGFNPDYSGLDFGEAASALIAERLLA